MFWGPAARLGKPRVLILNGKTRQKYLKSTAGLMFLRRLQILISDLKFTHINLFRLIFIVTLIGRIALLMASLILQYLICSQLYF